MRRLVILLFFCETLCLTGCYSLDVAKDPTSASEHVFVSNYGWSLFYDIPLVCGNATSSADANRSGPWAFFRNDVTMEKMQSRFMEYAKGKGEITDLCYHNYDNVMCSLPIGGFSIPIPYLICYREVQLSGVVK